MPVPLHPFARNVGVVFQPVNNPGHGTRERAPGVSHAVTERIARTDLDRLAVLFREPHKLVSERHDESVKVGARDVLEMTARNDSVVERGFDDGEILFHRLLAVEVHLFINMIVRAAHEYAGLFDAHFLDKLEIVLVGADPARDFGEFEPELAASAHGGAILFAVKEELARPNLAFRTAELALELENIDDLLYRKRRGGLLTVAESRIGYPPLLRGLHRHFAVVEHYFGNFVVIENPSVKVGLGGVVKPVIVLVPL